MNDDIKTDDGLAGSAARARGEAGEMGVPGVGARRRRGKTARLWIVAIAVVAAVGAAIGVSLFINRLTTERQARVAAARDARLKASTASTSGDHDFEGEKRRLKQQEDAAAAASAAAAGRAAAMPVPSGAPPVEVKPVSVSQPNGATASTRGAPGAPMVTQGSGLYSGVLLSLSGKSGKDSTSNAAPQSAGRPASTLGGTVQTTAAGARNLLDEQLSPSATSRAAMVHASLLPDLTYLLKHGTLIPCVGPRIVTTHPGMLTCTLMQDVYSANGRTLLLRKGATATGEQNKALLQGQARIFALWTGIDDGPVTVTLDSPATDPLGGSGIEAWVDTHFWTRFGGAMMVSMISDVGQALSNLTTKSGSGTTISLSNTSSAAQELAAETLKNTINVPPTGYANQGTVIYIYVARNIDFRSVYELVKE